MKKVRDSRFEVLRIISIFMITISHYAIYGNWNNLDNISAIETTKILILDMLGPIGAVVFFMITGYFHSYQKFEVKQQKSFGKTKQVWLKTWCYSVLMLGVSLLLKVEISTHVIIKTVLPVVMNEYWFITCYIVLSLLVPYIDIVLHNLTKQQSLKLLIILMMLMFVQLINSDIINRLVLTIFAYIVGFCIKKYSDDISLIKNTRFIYILSISLFLDILSIYVSRTVGLSFMHSAHFTQYVLPIVIGSVMLILTTKAKPFKNRVVNLYATSVLPIYLITENTAFSHFMWTKLLNVGQYQTSSFFYAIAIGITIALCLICSTFDIVVSNALKLVYRYITPKK